MRKLHRQELPPTTADYLVRKTAEIANSVDPHSTAMRAWGNKDRTHFAEVRKQLKASAGGLASCMYCDDSVGTDIDHFEPKTRRTSGTFEWLNYALACSACNSNSKRDKFPVDESGITYLINPFETDPAEHLQFHPTTCKYLTETLSGVHTIQVFDLNREELVDRRRDAWISMQTMARKYVDLRSEGRIAPAQRVLKTMRRHSFSEVLELLLSGEESLEVFSDDDITVISEALRALPS